MFKKIVVISDTHMQHANVKLPQGDLLIHCGDASNKGDAREFRIFSHWFRETPFKHRIFVAGNHDKFVEANRRLAVEMLGPEVQYLQDESTYWEGLEIYGSPWTPKFMNWAFMLDEEGLERAFDLIDQPYILVTHGPAYGESDEFLDFSTGKMVNIGSYALTKKLLTNPPKYHLFGHVHSGYGVRMRDGYVAVNAAICDEQYRPVNLPVVLNVC